MKFSELTKNLPEDKPIFVGETKIYNSTVNDVLTKHCKACGISEISIHGLRHTHASLLLFAGVSIASVARRLGHASMTTTQKTYLHIIQELETRIQTFYFEEVKAKPGAEALLQRINKLGIPAVAATSSPREHVRKALERNHLLPYLKEIYTTSEIGESKYSPKIYLTAAKSLNSSPNGTLVVEDSLYALITARDAGFQTAGIFDPFGEPDQEQLKKKADIYCRSLNELLNYME